MKLVLVDNLDSNMNEDRPNLGLAMLVAICQSQGISVKLINGQTRYLRQMFLEGREEIWELLNGLEENDLSGKKAEKETTRNMLALGKEGFEQKLETLYRQLVLEKSPRAYLDANVLNEFDDARACFMALYQNAINQGRDNFALIRFYVSEIVRAAPDVIGFSLYSKFDPLSRLVRQQLKQQIPAIPIVIGGPFSPFVESETIPDSFGREHYDYLVKGAGDEALPELVRAICTGQNPEELDIPNLCYPTKDGAFISEMKLASDINALPFPDFSQFELDCYLVPVRILPLLAARGCSYRKCSFCAHHLIYGNEYNALKPERVAETLAHLQTEYRCNFFMFNDDELPPARIRTISKAIKAKDIRSLRLCGLARLIKGFLDDALLELMREAGFRGMEWGVESASQKVLDLMRKGTDVSVAQEVLRKFHEQGMYNACFVFFGFPGESREDAEMTRDFLVANGEHIDALMVGYFIPDKESPIWESRHDIGLNIFEDGSYTVDGGSGSKEAKAFLAKFRNEVMLGNLAVLSPFFRQFDMRKMRRGLPLSMVGHKLLARTEPVGLRSEPEMDELFPVIVGHVRNAGNSATLFPVDLLETFLINRFAPLPAIPVDETERQIIEYCNGSRSLAEVINAVSRTEAEDIKRSDRTKICGFIEKVQTVNAVMFFGQRWEAASGQ